MCFQIWPHICVLTRPRLLFVAVDLCPFFGYLRYLVTALRGGVVRGRAAYRRRRQVSLDVGDAGRVVRHVGEDESLFVVILAEYLVLAQVEAVAHAEPATRQRVLSSGARTGAECTLQTARKFTKKSISTLQVS